MGDQTNWSVRLGRWGGVYVRLHIFFLLFVAMSLYIGAQSPGQVDRIAVTSLMILLASVIWHEFWHHRVALWLGGFTRESVLVPWGGLSSISIPPRDHKSELLIYLAGPLANLAICLVCVPPLLFFENVNILGHLNPIQPALVFEDGALVQSSLSLILWINWLLLLVNLIPASPFDGGKILIAALAPYLGREFASVMTARLAKGTALVLLIVAWFTRDPVSTAVVPVWFALVLLAILLFFSGHVEPERREKKAGEEDELFGYDFSQGYTSLERSTEVIAEEKESPIGHWLEQRRLARQQREVEQEAEEDSRVDEILSRLHRYGMAGLSDDDRALLERVSARYRNRLSDRA